MQGITGPSDMRFGSRPGAAAQAGVETGSPTLPAPQAQDGYSSSQAAPATPTAGVVAGAASPLVSKGMGEGALLSSQDLAVAGSLSGPGAGVTLAATAGTFAEAPALEGTPHRERLWQSPIFLGLDEGVRRLATKCLAYVERVEGEDVREATKSALRDRLPQSNGDGRDNVVGIATSEGFAGLAEPEQRKLLLSTCGAGKPHVLLTLIREKLGSMSADQQADMLRKMSQDLPLPERMEEPARVSLEGRPVLDYGETPYQVPSRDGTQEIRTGRTYGVTIEGRDITVVVPVDAPTEAGMRVPSMEQVVRALEALPRELRQGIEAVAVCPSRKPSRLGGETTALADSGANGMPGLLRLFPSGDWNQALVDATMVHEAGHVLSNRALGREGRRFNDPASTPGWTSWKEAMTGDGVSPSAYARLAPTEDLSETLRALFLVRGTPLEDEMRALMPQRFAQVDAMVPSWGASPPQGSPAS